MTLKERAKAAHAEQRAIESRAADDALTIHQEECLKYAYDFLESVMGSEMNDGPYLEVEHMPEHLAHRTVVMRVEDDDGNGGDADWFFVAVEVPGDRRPERPGGRIAVWYVNTGKFGYPQTSPGTYFRDLASLGEVLTRIEEHGDWELHPPAAKKEET